MGFIESTLQWVDKMLIADMIRLRDVPKEIRTSGSSVYITALRISNAISGERFVQDLKVLALDIYTMSEDDPQRERLVDVLCDYLSINEHEGEDVLGSFRKDLYPTVLQALQNRENARSAMFRNFRREPANV